MESLWDTPLLKGAIKADEKYKNEIAAKHKTEGTK